MTTDATAALSDVSRKDQANEWARAELRSFVSRLTLLLRERANVSGVLKDARRNNPAGIAALERELRSIAADMQKVRAEAAEAGYSAKALDVVVRETMETERERRKREELEATVDLYREALGLPSPARGRR